MSSNQVQLSSMSGEKSMPDMGFMKIHIHEANLSSDLLSHNETSKAEIIVSNTSLSQKNNTVLHKVVRETTHVTGTSPRWNDSVEIRCCVGWDIGISVIVEDPKMAKQGRDPMITDLPQRPQHNTYHNNVNNTHSCTSGVVLQVDNLVTGTCTSGQYYLRRDGKVCGDVYISFEYFPNHQSLKCLIEEVSGGGVNSDSKHMMGNVEPTRDPSLLMMLLSELVAMIRQSAKAQNHLPPHSPVNYSSGGLGAGIAMSGRSSGSGSGLHVDDFNETLRSDDPTPQKLVMSDAQRLESKHAWKQLHSCAFVLKEYLNSEMLQNFLLRHHFTSADSASSRIHPSSSDQSDGVPPSPPPTSVETFRVAAAARSFLNTVLLSPLLQSRQRLALHNSAGSSVSGSVSVASAVPHDVCHSAEYLPPPATISLIEKQLFMFLSVSRSAWQGGDSGSRIPPRMAWDDVMLFIQVISVWYLQHAYIAKSLCDEYRIHPAELSGIRDRFEKYDSHLSGDIPADMVAYLLQDMGEYYTPEEVRVLQSAVLDADSLGVVEFPELIRWWCSN